MKHISTYNKFINEANVIKRPNDIRWYLNSIVVGKVSYEKDGSVNIVGNINYYNAHINGLDIRDVPKGLKINSVSGDCRCSDLRLESLHDIAIPERVEGFFNIMNNYLKNLDGAPKYIGGALHTSANNIKNFKSPIEYIGNGIYASDNEIRSLKGLPMNYKGERRINFERQNIGDVITLKSLYRLMEQGNSWELALAIMKNDIPRAVWNNLEDKPSDEELEKLLHDNRGKLHTKKFGI